MSGSSLTQKVAQWPTPMAGTPAQNGNNAAGNSDFSRRADMLAEQVMRASAWPTPAARDYRTQNSSSLEERLGSKAGEQLPNAVTHGFTPPDLPKPADGPTFSERLRISRQLRAYVIAWHGPAVWRRLLKGRAARRLNTAFVEWLMGWPDGHALCAASETAFIRWQQDMRGVLSQLPTASGPWIWAPESEVPAEQQLTLFA